MHATVQRLLRLVPTSSPGLFDVLTNAFPHRRLSVSAHAWHVKHLLRVCRYAPSLQDRLLSLIVEKMIQIDVRGPLGVVSLSPRQGGGKSHAALWGGAWLAAGGDQARRPA